MKRKDRWIMMGPRYSTIKTVVQEICGPIKMSEIVIAGRKDYAYLNP